MENLSSGHAIAKNNQTYFNSRLKEPGLFQTAFLQVFLVSINTIFLSKGIYTGVAIAGFMISYVWVGNVKKASIATKKDQIIYSLGAMAGGLSGLLLTDRLL